jgi:hypothetical protein
MKIAEPTTMMWNGMKLVKISECGEEFKKWMYGQTIPFVEDWLDCETESPTDWAYSWDYDRFIKGLKVID